MRELKGEKLEAELKRLEALKAYEKEYEHLGYVAGIDEVGRGPFAGPVVACCVILPKDCNILYINDSKKLSEKRREELFDIITKEAVAYGIGIVDNTVIDEINILNATYEAMRQATGKLSVKPDVLLNDAVTIPGVDIKQVPIIKGDAKSISIGAASIIAKVTRDRIMKDLAQKYPQYEWEKNAGYPTQQHLQAIDKYGINEHYRKTYRPIKERIEKNGNS